MVQLPECVIEWTTKQAPLSAHQSLSQPLSVPRENLGALKQL